MSNPLNFRGLFFYNVIFIVKFKKSAFMSEEKKPDWKFDFRSEDSVKDLAGCVVRAGNVCKYLVDHLPTECNSATQFSVANMLVIAEHSLSCVCNILVNYQKIAFDVLKSDKSTEARPAE